MKTVDNHNSTVIRQQLEAAEAARSNSGLGESSRSAASRMFGGALRDASKARQGQVKGRGMRSDDFDPGRGRGVREEREREQRWHDKRQGSRERRTRYDVGEEEEMMNSGSGMEILPESKERQDWMKRKSIKDEERRRERELEDEEDDFERRKRRNQLYGDDEEEDEYRRTRKYEDDETHLTKRGQGLGTNEDANMKERIVAREGGGRGKGRKRSESKRAGTKNMRAKR
jgi:hypothetical protein